MKPKYLICSINSKNKLVVESKVNAYQLKKIELKMTLAKKLKEEVKEWHLKNKQPMANSHTYNQEYFAWHKLWSEFHPTITKQLDGVWVDDFINTYEGAIIIPYTKILE